MRLRAAAAIAWNNARAATPAFAKAQTVFAISCDLKSPICLRASAAIALNRVSVVTPAVAKARLW